MCLINKIKNLKKSERRNKNWLMTAEAQNTTVIIDCWYVQAETGDSYMKVDSETKKTKKERINFMNNLWHFLVVLCHFSHETKSMKHIIHVALT